MRSTLHEITAAATLLPLVANDDSEGTGTAVDLLGYETATALFLIGASGDTLSGSVKFLPTLQESDDGTGWTDVAAADLDGTLTLVDGASDDETIQAVGYLGSKRYLRAFYDFTGTHTNGCPLAAVIVRGAPKTAPTS